MNTHETDLDWELFAKDDPYWAVLTQDKFRRQNLDAKAKDEFFASGEAYIDWVFDRVRKHVAPAFDPHSALDFGCGVGRLVVPLAKKCDSVVGVDVSGSMLEEAQKACAARGVRGARFVQGLDKLNVGDGRFDFINSFIVFQHIPCQRGLELLRRLVGLLGDGGVAAIHLTFSRFGYSGAPNGQLPVEYGILHYTPPDGFRYHWRGLRKAARRILAERTRQIFSPGQRKEVRTARESHPVMQMNSYLLNPVLHMLQEAGVREFHAAFSGHSDALGLVLFFRKNQAEPYSSEFLFEK